MIDFNNALPQYGEGDLEERPSETMLRSEVPDVIVVTEADLREASIRQTERDLESLRHLVRELDRGQRLTVEKCLKAPKADLDPQGPVTGEKLLSLVVAPGRLEEALGDLAEGFQRLHQRHGRRHATRWYYWQIGGIVLGGVMRGCSQYAREWIGFYFSQQ